MKKTCVANTPHNWIKKKKNIGMVKFSVSRNVFGRCLQCYCYVTVSVASLNTTVPDIAVNL